MIRFLPVVRSIAFVLILALTATACGVVQITTDGTPEGGSTPSGEEKVEVVKVLSGKASYYADKFHGRSTASGEKYDKTKLTAAHRNLPFGTRIRVTNLKNGKKVIARVNDRGPFVKGRIVDLSRAAAESIDMVRDGVVSVRVEVLK